ncbi:hypothetical protein MHN80_22665, partial [Gordonia McavH-238-E]|nr:hypothetical protein [Gordonia sp. McavH-238-E]
AEACGWTAGSAAPPTGPAAAASTGPSAGRWSTPGAPALDTPALDTPAGNAPASRGPAAADGPQGPVPERTGSGDDLDRQDRWPDHRRTPRRVVDTRRVTGRHAGAVLG